MTATKGSVPLTEAVIDEILGFGLCRPKRLGWWETDLVDPDGGGDLIARLAPRTHAWAALETVRALVAALATPPDEYPFPFCWVP